MRSRPPAPGQRAGLLGSQIEVTHDCAGPLQIGPAGLGQHDVAGGATREADPEVLLQLPHPAADQRRVHAQPVRGLAEAEGLAQCDEGPEVAQGGFGRLGHSCTPDGLGVSPAGSSTVIASEAKQARTFRPFRPRFWVASSLRFSQDGLPLRLGSLLHDPHE